MEKIYSTTYRESALNSRTTVTIELYDNVLVVESVTTYTNGTPTRTNRTAYALKHIQRVQFCDVDKNLHVYINGGAIASWVKTEDTLAIAEKLVSLIEERL